MCSRLSHVLNRIITGLVRTKEVVYIGVSAKGVDHRADQFRFDQTPRRMMYTRSCDIWEQFFLIDVLNRIITGLARTKEVLYIGVSAKGVDNCNILFIVWINSDLFQTLRKIYL
jgi:hypothetical protein